MLTEVMHRYSPGSTEHGGGGTNFADRESTPLLPNPYSSGNGKRFLGWYYDALAHFHIITTVLSAHVGVVISESDNAATAPSMGDKAT